jgi:hypothetical protein
VESRLSKLSRADVAVGASNPRRARLSLTVRAGPVWSDPEGGQEAHGSRRHFGVGWRVSEKPRGRRNDEAGAANQIAATWTRERFEGYRQPHEGPVDAATHFASRIGLAVTRSGSVRPPGLHIRRAGA